MRLPPSQRSRRSPLLRGLFFALFVPLAACSGSKLQPLYPTPRYVATEAPRVALACDTHVDVSGLPQHALLSALLPELLSLRGQSAGSGGCTWQLDFAPTPPALGNEASTAWTLAGDNPERYALVTRHDGKQLHTQIYAPNERAAVYALISALALPQAATIVDWPAIPLRGLIEGYYGKPFTPSERLITLKRMGWLRQNLFLYGPKDDPYARAKWATPYPADQAQGLATVAAEAHKRLIDFVWSISPGYAGEKTAPITPIQYSSDADFARLSEKIESVRALGVRKFSLFLDDISPSLVHEADKQKFASPVEAHAALMNRLQEYLLTKDSSARLLVVGTAYAADISGWGAYNLALGKLLRADIDVMWTGPGTFSQTIRSTDMVSITTFLRRKLVIWDNWPLAVRPLSGRSADLGDSIGGFLTNIMLSQDNKHPPADTWAIMGTFADYGWNPTRYDPNPSLLQWKQLLPSL